jgi:futalosine hydrolase
MILIAAATENEIKPLRFPTASPQAEILITGMGPVAAAASLSRHLALHGVKIDAVLNIGVAGAYIGSGINLLDICLAQHEILGDLGICMQDRIIDFQPGLGTTTYFEFKNEFIPKFKNIFTNQNIVFKNVNFVTVNCCTGTKERGEFLRRRHDAGCENMEGAAVAMVCQNFNVPCVELRCISNMVDDRDTTQWQLSEAIEKICLVADTLLQIHLKD